MLFKALKDQFIDLAIAFYLFVKDGKCSANGNIVCLVLCDIVLALTSGALTVPEAEMTNPASVIPTYVKIVVVGKF